MYGCPVAGGAVKELIDYKRREGKNQDSDHKFVEADRRAFFRGQVALMYIIGHGKSSIRSSRMNDECFRKAHFDRDQFSRPIVHGRKPPDDCISLPLIGTLIFRLFLEGDGTKGPMGVKAVLSWLNHHGFRNAKGNPFYTSAVHAILTRETYSGVHYYKCPDGRTRRERSKSEWARVGQTSPRHASRIATFF
jgi:Recombinase